MNNKINNNNETLLRKLISFLKIEFFADKFFDFILLFIGLYAALSLENTIDSNRKHNEYIEDLKNLYIEINTNKHKSLELKNFVEQYLTYVNEIVAHYNVFYEGEGPGYIFDLDKVYYSFDYYKTFNKNIFKNKNLLSDVNKIYSMYESTKDNAETTYDVILDFTKLYIYDELYNNTDSSIVDIPEFNYLYVRSRTLTTETINLANYGFNTAETILKNIEKELSSHGKDLHTILSDGEIYHLGESALSAVYYNDAYQLFNKGLSRMLENESYKNNMSLLGNYYRSLGNVIVYDIVNGHNKIKNDVDLIEAEDYLFKSIDLEYDVFVCYMYLAMIYDYNNNEDTFYKYLELSLENGYDNFNQLRYELFRDRGRNKSERFIELLDKYQFKK